MENTLAFLMLLLTLGLCPVWQVHLTVSGQFIEEIDLCSSVHCPQNYTCQQSRHEKGKALIASCIHRCNFTCPSAAYEVCGSDGETYLNPCLFTKEHCFIGQLEFVSFGQCRKEEGSPRIILKACKVGNKTYSNGQSFYMEEKCEYCTCSNEVVKCQKYFCNKTVNSTEAEVDLELKKTILKAIYIQYEHRKYIIKPEITEENLGLIPLETALLHRVHRLRWTFRRLDKNKDEKLTEEYEFRFLMEEIDHLFISKPTFLRLFSIFNKDSDKFITEDEWLTGFDDLEPSSHEGSGAESASRRRRKSHTSAPKLMKNYATKLQQQMQSNHF